MTIFKTGLLAAGVMATTAIVATPAAAQADKVATVDSGQVLFGAVALGNAYKAIGTKYDAQIKQAQTRQTALATTVKPLYDRLDLNRDGQFDDAERQSAIQAQRPEVKQIVDAETAANNETNGLIRPVTIARIYLFEQLQTRFSKALEDQMRTKGVALILPSNTVVRQSPTVDLTATIKPLVDLPLSIDPPANYQPSQTAVGLYQNFTQILEQSAQQQAAEQQAAQAQPQPGAARPAATPATGAPKRDRNGNIIKQ